MTLATVYNFARPQMTPVKRAVVDTGGGVGVMICAECDGNGIWDYMMPEIPAEPCVDCKGTGRRFIAYWPA